MSKKKKKHEELTSLPKVNPIDVIAKELSKISNMISEELTTVETVERARHVLTDVQHRLDNLLTKEELDSDNFIVTNRVENVPDILELSSFLDEK